MLAGRPRVALLATLIAVAPSGCASTGGAGPSPAPATPVGATRLEARPACAGTSALEVSNPSEYDVSATLWMADRTTRNLDFLGPRETKRFRISAAVTAVAVSATGRGFDMTRLGGGTTSAAMTTGVKLLASWVCEDGTEQRPR